MQTDLLKTMFGGDKGAPTPPGIRMQGIFAAATGFSVQFFPESAVLGCGPDAARAYPYMVAADGTNAVIQIGAPDHPLRLPSGRTDRWIPAAARVTGARTQRYGAKRGRRLHLRSNGADLQSCCSSAEQDNSSEWWNRCNHDGIRRISRNKAGQRRWHALCSGRAVGKCHTVHRIGISCATGHTESARRTTFRYSARQLRRRTGKRRLCPAGNVA
jgi:hypothetical protein